jgi:hypothetical protein
MSGELGTGGREFETKTKLTDKTMLTEILSLLQKLPVEAAAEERGSRGLE